MKRSAALDLLRGLAVVLVLFRHSTFDGWIQDIGWIGVDLFFVLSGYLVAGIVFREFLTAGSFDARRFFLRRGLKIYPAFYFFLIVSISVNYYEHHLSYEPRLILSEVFFLQSYLPHVWTHTWSIAVEEHFYLILILCSVLWLSKNHKVKASKVLTILTVSLTLIFFLRLIKCYPERHMEEFAFFSTHLRMDGIVVGVMVAVLKYFSPMWQLMKQKRFFLLPLALILVCPALILPGGGFIMNTIGLTLMNLGFGCLLLFVLMMDEKGNDNLDKSWSIFKPLSFIGIHSYSIYLWHLLVLQECQQIDVSENLRNVVYLMLAVLTGVFFSLVIERPVLKLREKLFPTTSN